MTGPSVPESGPIVRLATEQDTETVASLVRNAYRPYVARIGRPPAPMNADHARAIADGAVWVLVHGAEVAGAITLHEGDGHMLIESVAVAPPMQRRGFGIRLLTFAEERARERGLPEVRLYTNQLMTENLAFYRRHGYVETGHGVEDGFKRVFFSKRVMPRV